VFHCYHWYFPKDTPETAMTSPAVRFLVRQRHHHAALRPQCVCRRRRHRGQRRLRPDLPHSGGLSTRIVGATDQRQIDSTDSSLTYTTDIVIHLSTPLKNGLNYSITMGSGAVIDSSDDGNARISSPNLFKFTASGSAAIPTPSAVVGSTLHFTDTGTSGSDYLTATAEQTMTGTYTGTWARTTSCRSRWTTAPAGTRPPSTQPPRPGATAARSTSTT
jgi:hypothetical protein